MSNQERKGYLCVILTCQGTKYEDSKKGYCMFHYKNLEDYESYYGLSE